MKKLLVLALICASVTTATVFAQKTPLTDDQKAFKTEMLAKYDTNKDGKLDKDEMSKMSDEDKAKWKKMMPKHKKKDSADTTTSTNSVSTNAVSK